MMARISVDALRAELHYCAYTVECRRLFGMRPLRYLRCWVDDSLALGPAL